MATPHQRIPMGSVKIFPLVFGISAEQLGSALTVPWGRVPPSCCSLWILCQHLPKRAGPSCWNGNNQQDRQGSGASGTGRDTGMAKAPMIQCSSPGTAGKALTTQGWGCSVHRGAVCHRIGQIFIHLSLPQEKNDLWKTFLVLLPPSTLNISR